MTDRGALLVAVALAGLTASPRARADTPHQPDRSRVRAEGEHRREGFAIHIGVGPTASIGRNADGVSIGPGFHLRLGRVAGPDLVWMLQLDTATYLVDSEDMDTDETVTDVNVHSVLVVGPQYYVLESLWLRGGLGVATLVTRQKGMDDSEDQQAGFGSGAGLGVDVVRRGAFVLSLEGSTMLGLFRGPGVVWNGSLGIAIGWI